ncbi:MAG: hypothetical protein Q8S14_08140 [Algoriphagus sp.]|uniref:hypothetical protein n=1 Tax=Algoriphagus sp. TaxID=1872435 RepID=UPI002730E24E|nr:hypothetical protein [Algoriphagus sp.]MDP2043445.1 hypothetical protein [Algoriphagus sp.]MDP3471830.1 hypothetical protein [Algoriphagus sp.]
MAAYIFKETQQFRQVWIWAILLGATGLSIWALFWGNPTKPSNGWEKALPLLILFLVNGLFLSLKLIIKIDQNTLRFSYFPFVSEKKYKFDDIISMELIEYNSLFNYGGWGIRYNFDSWAYNVRGNHGIKVKTLKRKFLLGTQKPEEARRAIEQFKKYKLQSYGS